MKTVETPEIDLNTLDIAVAIPCLNEEVTIADLVDRVDEVLPMARIYVMDNASTDATAERARSAGAEVISVPLRGKGNAVASMFAEIDADVIVMMDGDGTYDPRNAPELIRLLIAERCDMVIGARKGIWDDAHRKGHALGNRLFNWLYKQMFGAGYKDIFTGYRVFSRRFVKSFPALSSGFEIETELSVHSQVLRLPVREIEVPYGERPDGSESKLSTVRDSIRILSIFMVLMKEVKPFFFFSVLASTSLAASTLLAAPVISEYYTTGLVERLPTWVMAVTMLVMSLLFLICGLVLDSVAKGRLEQKRIASLMIPRLTVDDLHDRLPPEEDEDDTPSNVTRIA